MFAHIIPWFVHLLPAATGAGQSILDGANQACSSCGGVDLPALMKRGANILTFLVGSVSVLMIIYGGFRYVISRGDAAQIKVAKDTILYAVVGVIIAVVAFAIIKFVASTLGK